MAKNNMIFWIAGIALLFIVASQYNFNQDEDFSIKVHYYDEDGNEIDFQPYNYEEAMKQTFSIGSMDIVEDNSLISNSISIDEDVVDHDTENNVIVGKPSYQPTSFKDFINNLDMVFSNIGLFGIVTTTKTITIYSSITDSIQKDFDSGNYFYDNDYLDDIGSDQPDPDIRNAVIRFYLYNSLPSDLTTSSQITSARLYYKTKTIFSDEGNGASIDFCVVDNVESYDFTPNDEAEERDMWQRLEDCSSNGFIYSYDFHENQEEIWFNNEIATASVKNEIIDNKDGSPDNYLTIGLEGESDSTDDERVDFYGETTSYKPYLVLKYSVSTCVAETCSSLGKQCGSWSNTCSGTVNCGSCPTNYDCDVNGQCIYNPIYISLEVSATNTGDVNFSSVKISSASPIELQNALDLNDIRLLNEGYSTTWHSSQIIIKPEWRDTTQTFTAYVRGVVGPTGEVITKSSQIQLAL